MEPNEQIMDDLPADRADISEYERQKDLPAAPGSVEMVCTKDDPHQISVCQCPDCMAERKTVTEDTGVLVTDEHLKGWGTIPDIVFYTCPVCGEESVAVTPLTGKLGRYCLNEACRVKVRVQSAELTKYVQTVSRGLLR